jgi:hypothetical protein
VGVGEWGSLFEVDADGNSVQTAKGLMISLVGFNMQNKITTNKEFLENCRDEAKGCILSMLGTVFDNDNDQQSIANCLENHRTWAIFAGAEKKNKPKAKNKINFLPEPSSGKGTRSKLNPFMWPMIGYLTTMGGRLLPN